MRIDKFKCLFVNIFFLRHKCSQRMALVQHFMHWGTSFSPVSEMHWAWSAQSPPECGTPCILELMKHARRFPDRVSTPCDAQGRGQLPADWSIPDGMVLIYPALGSFRRGTKVSGVGGTLVPSILSAALPALGASAAAPGKAPARKHGTGREEVSSELQPPPAAPEGSTRTGEGGGDTGATVAEAVRCPGGHRGATPRRGGGRGRAQTRGGRRGGAEDAGEAEAPRPGAPLKTTTERCGLAFPLPAGRGRDGTSLLPPPPPPAEPSPPARLRTALLPCPHLRAPTPGSRPFPGPRRTARERRLRGGRCRPWMPFVPSGPARCPRRFAPRPASPRAAAPLPWASTAAPTRASTPWAAWRGQSRAPTCATRWAPMSWAAAAAAAAPTPTRPTTTRRPTAGTTPPTDTGRCGSSRPPLPRGRRRSCREPARGAIPWVRKLARFFFLFLPEAS